MSFTWEKKGLIFATDKKFDWSQTHTTLPSPILLSEDLLRIFYTSRDKNQKSRISYIDVNPKNINQILKVADKPVLDLGNIGMYDDQGIVTQFIMAVEDKHYLYVGGYNIGTTSRYKIGIGLAISSDNCNTFEKYSEGPLMDRSIYDPCGCATPFIITENGVFRMWYASFIKWEMIDGDPEPFYRIAYAESKDGISWYHPQTAPCIDLKDDEGGIVRPAVVKIGDKYHMWFSVRKNTGYRDNLNSSYRIGYAVSDDGLTWERNDNEAGIDVSAEGWDSEMIGYTNIMRIKDTLYMFYVGNGFGKSGFGYATAEIK